MSSKPVQQAFSELRYAIPQQCPERGDPDRAASLIVSIAKHLEEDLKLHEFDLLISTWLPRDQQERGIIALLTSAKACNDVQFFKLFKAETCRILASILPKISRTDLERVAQQIKDVSWQLSDEPEESRVRVEALQLQVALVSACAGTDWLQAAHMLDRLLTRDLVRRPTPSVRQQQLHLLGVLCRYHPGVAAPHADRICRLMLTDLETQIGSTSGKLEKAVVAGALQGLTCFLHSFSQSPDDNPEVCRRIYESVKKVINPDVNLSRREAPRAGLDLLAAHAAQFGPHLLKDYRLMYRFMITWATAQNRDDSRAGVAALGALLDQLIRQLSEPPGDMYPPATSARLPATSARSPAASAQSPAASAQPPATSPQPSDVYRFLRQRLRQLMDESFSTAAVGVRPQASASVSASAAVLSVVVRAYGALAAPCRRIATPDELDQLVSSLLQRAEQRYPVGAEPLSEDLQQLPGYVWAVADAVCLPPSITAGQQATAEQTTTGQQAAFQQATAERLLLLLAERYPRVPPQHRFLAHAALTHALHRLLTRPDLGQPAVDALVYQMVLRACSHPVALEAELGRDAARSYAQRVVGVSDFMPMWDALLSAQQQRYLTTKGATQASLAALSASVHGALLDAAQRVLDDLDLTTEAPSDDDSGTLPAEHIDPADPASGVTAKTPKDFQVLLNLVDLLEHVLLQPALAERNSSWVPLLVRRLVADSRRAPLVSALYRLIAVSLTLCGTLGLLQQDGELRRLLAEFVSETAARCRQYQDELQAACVQMTLASPPELLPGCAAHLLHTAQIGLRLGRSHLPLASAALDALDRWLPAMTSLDDVTLISEHADALRPIVPLLSQYLSPDVEAASDGSGEGSGSIRSRSAVNVAKISQAQLRSGSQLSALRARALQLLGQLAAAGLVTETGGQLTAWSRAPILGLAVPFHDLKPTLWLEPLLPRVVELALSAADAQTRATACELLHAVIVYTIGKGAARGVASGQLGPVYSRLLPALLTLAADTSLLVRQLFEPLLMQTVHWFSHPEMANRPEADALRNAIMEGLVDAEEAARRGLCARTLRELLHWLLAKQRGDPVQKAAPILEPIYALLRHPDPYRRLGGTVAFNSVYRELREHAPLVDAHAIQVTVALLGALARAHSDPAQMGTLTAAQTAVKHCQRILDKCTDTLCKESSGRCVPAGTEIRTLRDLSRWLWRQGAAPQTEYARSCLRLASRLCNISRLGETKEEQLEMAGGVVALFEARLCAATPPELTDAAPFTWLRALITALYAALTVEQYKLEAFSSTESCLMDHVRRLFEWCASTTDGSAEVAALKFQALRLVISLLSDPSSFQQVRVTSVWSPAAADTMARIVLAPEELRCGAEQLYLPGSFQITSTWPPGTRANDPLKNVDVIENSDMFHLLKTAYITPSSSHSEVLHALDRYAAGRHIYKEVESALIGGGDRLVTSYLRGVLLLACTQLCTLEEIGRLSPQLAVSGDRLLELVWSAQVQDTSTGLVLRQLAPAQKRVAHAALVTALNLRVTPEYLLKLLLSEQLVLSSPSGGAVERGWLLFRQHQTALTAALLDTQLMRPVVGELVTRAPHHRRGIHLLTALAQSTLTDRRLTAVFGPRLAELVRAGWPQLSAAGRQLQLLPLLFLLLQLQRAAAAHPDLVAWYRRLLDSPGLSLEQKKSALRLLSYMLRYPTLADHVGEVLDGLISRHFPLNSSELRSGSPERAAYTAALRALCDAVQWTALPALAGRLAALLSREQHHPCQTLLTEALTAATRRHGADKLTYLAVELLNQLNTELGRSPTSRLTLLTSCLEPLLRSAGRAALLQFFSGERVRELINIVARPEPPSSESASERIEQAWVARTVAFCLLEVLYARLERGDVHDASSPLLVAYTAPAVAKGNELTRALVAAGMDAFRAAPPRLPEAPDLAEARRLCTCAAYRALAATICATQTDAKFFNRYLFDEDPVKHKLIWSRLVSRERRYTFPLDRATIPQTKPTSIPVSDNTAPGVWEPRKPAGSVTQFLADSSLCSQVALYDFTNSVVLNSQEMNQQEWAAGGSAGAAGGSVGAAGGSVALAPDDLNDHECMPTLTALVQHMTRTVEPPPEHGTPAEPSWASSIRRRLEDVTTPVTVVQLLAKLVTNCADSCRTHAAALLPGLMRVTTDHRLGQQLDALLLDTLEMVAAWAHEDGVLPADTEEQRAAAGAFLERVIEITPHTTRAVVRCMLDIFSRLVRGWGGRAPFPTAAVHRLLTQGDPEQRAPLVGVSALGVALLTQQPVSLTPEQRDSTLRKLLSMVGQGSAEVYRRAAEVVALLFTRALQTEDEATVNTSRDTITATLRSVESREQVRWVNVLACMANHCPQLALSQGSQLLNCLPSLRGQEKAQALRVMQAIADDITDVTTRLTALGLPQLAVHRDQQLQTEALKLLARIEPRLSATELAAYLPSIRAALNYGGEEARRTVAAVCISLRERSCSDEAERNVRDCATGALLRLLTDSDITARQKAANHWSDAAGLEDTTAGRLELVLRQLFWPGLESAYLSYSTYLVLGLAARSPDFHRPMFERALASCQFQDVAIVNSWRVQSRATVPLFTQTCAAGAASAVSALRLATQAGPALVFSPTQAEPGGAADWVSQASVPPLLGDTQAAPDSLMELVQPRRPQQPAPNRLTYRDAGSQGSGDSQTVSAPRRRRFEADRGLLSKRFAVSAADQQALQQQRKAEQDDRRDATVDVMRKYRDGELPDTEIPYSDLIRPLQALAMRDGPTAQRLLVSLLSGTLAALGDQQRRQQLVAAASAGLELTLRRLRSPDACLVAAALEAARQTGAQLPAELIVQVSRASGQLSQGILLLEKQLQELLDCQPQPSGGAEHQSDADPPPAKRPRTNQQDQDQLWTALAELYRLYGDWDGARAAFARRRRQPEHWAAALDAEAAGELVAAQKLYRTALQEAGTGDGMCQTAYFQCLSELSQWDRISDHLDRTLTPEGADRADLSLLWSQDGSGQLLLEWLMLSKTQLALEGDSDASEYLRSLINDQLTGEQRHVLEERYAEELAVLYAAAGDLAWARHFCDAARSAFLRRWSDTSASSGRRRKLLLHQLRRLTELQEYLSLASGSQPATSEAVSSLLERWQASSPTPQQSLVFWESVVTRRQMYASRLFSDSACSAVLMRFKHISRLRLVEAALAQGNHAAAVRHLNQLANGLPGESGSELEMERRLLLVRTKLLQSRSQDDITTARRSLEKRVPLSGGAPLPPALLLKRTKLEVDLMERSAELDSADTSSGTPLLRALDRLSDTMSKLRYTPQEADATLETALFCGRHMQRPESSSLSDTLRKTFVSSTMAAMVAGSVAAADWVPWLLQLANDHTDAAQQFQEKCNSVPAWMLLAWLPQLFSYAGSAAPVGVPLRALLASLAQLYPQAVVYPYLLARASAATAPATAKLTNCLDRLSQLLAAEQLPLRLCAELAALQWRQLLSGQLVQLAATLEAGQLPAAAHLWTEAAETMEKHLSAPTVPQTARKLAVDLQKLCHADGAGVTLTAAQSIAEKAKLLARGLRSFDTWPAATSLVEYSGWLASFQDVQQGCSLELPGQYGRRRKPMPESHVRVANFSQKVRVLASKERPLCLTVRGDDAREYHYLVKSGDDTRTDQRLQQLFSMVNSSLAADAAAHDRRLTLRTYQVLPLRPTLGLIEWMDNTETLRDFIASGCDKFEDRSARARQLHLQQMRSRSGRSRADARSVHAPYALQAERDRVVEDFLQRAACLPTDALREAVWRLSAGAESFVSLRAQMVVSHALLAVAGWLLGVGDRHLGNLLVSTENGAMVGIDFGYAFGSATHLFVPEVVPFRMTPQLTGLTAPLGTTGVAHQTMCVALAALRRSHQLLSATLEVFVREPTVDWRERARRAASAIASTSTDGAENAAGEHQTDGDADAGSVTEFARGRVAAARRRLVGGHPSADLCDLLTSGPHSADLTRVMTRAVRGRAGEDPRADLPDQGLTVQQQVTALLDLATDPYILGLTWTGWDAHI